MSTMKLGWSGVGNMGAPMIQRLLDAGHGLLVHDIRPTAAQALRSADGVATSVASIGQLATGSEVVFLSLPTIEAVRSVVQDLLSSVGGALRVIVNTGTTGASLSQELAAAAAPLGVSWVDCPVSGGPEAVRAGLLSVMVSGADEDVERLRPLLLHWGKTITIAGHDPGAAQTLKLVNNAVIVASYVGTLEAFLFGAKAGLSPQVMLDAINGGRLAHNGTTRVWLPDYILRGKPFGAKLHLLMKDMGLALSESAATGVAMDVSNAALEVAQRACAGGLDEGLDLMDLMRALESAAKFDIPRNPEETS